MSGLQEREAAGPVAPAVRKQKEMLLSSLSPLSKGQDSSPWRVLAYLEWVFFPQVNFCGNILLFIHTRFHGDSKPCRDYVTMTCVLVVPLL